MKCLTIFDIVPKTTEDSGFHSFFFEKWENSVKRLDACFQSDHCRLHFTAIRLHVYLQRICSEYTWSQTVGQSVSGVLGDIGVWVRLHLHQYEYQFGQQHQFFGMQSVENPP
eukprot:866843_1